LNGEERFLSLSLRLVDGSVHSLYLQGHTLDLLPPSPLRRGEGLLGACVGSEREPTATKLEDGPLVA